MKRFTAIPWPWVGLVLTLALLGQEILFRWFGATPSLAESLYRVLVMALGATSLALLLLPPRRLGYLLGFLVCAGLMGWALWLQYGLGLEPCPLCALQRLAVTAIGVVFLVACIHNPNRFGATMYGAVVLLIAAAGGAVAVRHVWLQALPADQVPACGMGLSYMLDTLPLFEVLGKVFAGSGECAEKGWIFLSLAIPGWTLVFFISIAIYALMLSRRD